MVRAPNGARTAQREVLVRVSFDSKRRAAVAQYVTESIWHFVGYMHIEELLSKTSLLYSGAGAYKLETIDHSKIGAVRYEAEVLFSTARNTLPFKPSFPIEPQLIFQTQSLSIEPTDLRVPPAAKLPLDLSTVLPGLGSDAGISIDSDPAVAARTELKVDATYTVGESQYSDIHIMQANFLFDVDIMRGNPDVILNAGLELAAMHALEGGSEQLAELVQKAIDALPSNATPGLPPDGIDRESIAGDGVPEIQVPLDSDAVAQAVGTGRYVNGDRVGNASTSTDVIEAQIGKVNAAVEAATPVEHSSPVETQTASNGGSVHVVSTLEPTGGVAQEVVAGGNNLVNAAVLYDLADAAGSMIVRGDVHVTDATVQVNVLQDNDEANASGDATGFSSTAFLAAAVAANEAGSGTADNAVTNEAVFAQETGPVYGNVALGGWPGSLIWQVDYVQGNFYDLTTVEQTNLIVDGDIAEQTTSGTHFVATLGEDGAINLVQLSELGASYDLIIVGGHLYEVNAIVQVNVLLDDDIVDQVAQGDGGSQAINTDGNVLSNDAAIVRIGGDSYKPLDGNPEALADAIGGMQSEFDASLTTGLPGNGTDTLKVLYITGDYYNYNVLSQTNLLDDADQVQQVAPAAGDTARAGESGGTAQTADTGSNTLENVALLVNVDSTSDYQFVGGEVYEDTLLVQANIVADEDDGNAADLHPDVVATVAALVATDDAASGSDIPADHANASASVDVIGGVLA
jgi:hypothetical protein